MSCSRTQYSAYPESRTSEMHRRHCVVPKLSCACSFHEVITRSSICCNVNVNTIILYLISFCILYIK